MQAVIQLPPLVRVVTTEVLSKLLEPAPSKGFTRLLHQATNGECGLELPKARLPRLSPPSPLLILPQIHPPHPLASACLCLHSTLPRTDTRWSRAVKRKTTLYGAGWRSSCPLSLPMDQPTRTIPPRPSLLRLPSLLLSVQCRDVAKSGEQWPWSGRVPSHSTQTCCLNK